MWHRLARYDAQRSLENALGATPAAQRAWDEADEQHQEAYVRWVRGAWTEREQRRRMSVAVANASSGQLLFVRAQGAGFSAVGGTSSPGYPAALGPARQPGRRWWWRTR